MTAIVTSYCDNATRLRLLETEIQLNSWLKKAYTERMASRVVKVTRRIIERLVERGIYRLDVDLNFIVFTLLTLRSQNIIQKMPRKRF